MNIYTKMFRKIEIKLLFLASFYLFAGIGVLIFLSPASRQNLIFAGIIAAACVIVLSLIWLLAGYKGDPFLLPLVFLICATSLLFLYRINPVYAIRQFTWLVVGLLLLGITTGFLLNYKILAEKRVYYLIIGVLALLLPVFWGSEHGGAKRWFEIGMFTVQTSEFVKILFVLFCASYLSERRFALRKGGSSIHGFIFPDIHEWKPVLGGIAAFIAPLFFQKDLGTVLIFLAVFLIAVFLSTGRISYLALGGAACFPAAALMYFAFDHVQLRIAAWLDPWSEAASSGYQVIQSKIALASGGLTGTGLGAGYPNFVPEVHTDFIFAAVTEELGLAGGMGILVLYVLLVYRGFVIALSAEDDFSMLLAAGLSSLLGVQSLLIVGGVIGLLPLTGVTLPFLSYGGSSLIASFIVLGLLLNISHKNRKFNQAEG